MLKVMIIDFTRYNPWGTVDYATHYYVNGKRISKDCYFRFYTLMDGWKFDRHEEKDDRNKDGIFRHYCINYYIERKKSLANQNMI